MEYNIKLIREEFKAKGIFYTPPELGEFMKSFVDIEFDEVYDPTCGNGSLLSIFPDNIKKYGQEINEHQIEIAKERLKNFNGYCGDTLKNPAFLNKKFKCIIANPPFSIKWDTPNEDERFAKAPALPPKSKADYAFILHCIHYLDDEGIAVVLNFPGILYRGNSELKIRKWLIECNYIDKIISIPPKTFVDTTIPTALIVFRKNKKTKDIIFIDKENNKEKIVSIDEVIKNNYNLSVNCYIEKDKEVIRHNPIELNANARNAMVRKLKADIEIDKMICELEGYDFSVYLRQLQEIILHYKNMTLSTY